MKQRATITFACIAAIAAIAAALTGCTSPPAVPPADAPPPPEVELSLPLEPPPVSQLCKLGTSCMDLDTRPFELCLLATEHCPKDAQLIHADGATPATPAAPVAPTAPAAPTGPPPETSPAPSR